MLLPDMDGEKIFQEMKKMNPEVPIVFISGQIGLEEERMKEKGVYAFLQKPFDIDEIFGLLNKIVEEKKTNSVI